MSLWEYKVITSGKGGFASPALLEKFLNDLGRDEWEIIHFHTPPDNFLAFTGLARRSTQRDWTLEDAAAAAAKAEAEKLRAEFEAKFKAANQPALTPAEERASFIEEKVAPDDGFRKPVDTSRDDEPEAAEDEKDEWDKLGEEDELPTFFEAIKPHMRKNQRGPGMSVGVDYLAKKWDQTEDDLKGALIECGFVMPADEDAKAEYLEYDGDLYWLNINRRGELWINTKEKPRPVFRSVKAQKITLEEEAPRQQPQPQQPPVAAEAKTEAGEAEAKPAAEKSDEPNGKSEPSAQPASKGAPLPEGVALLDKIRPHMRRNRRGPGGSGSTNFLSRALRTNEAELKSAFIGLGLIVPATPNDKPAYTEIGNELWWLNVDSRGGLWINGREKRQGEAAQTASESVPPTESTPGAAPSEAVPESAVAAAPETAPAAESAPAALAAETPAPAPAAPEQAGEASERAREVAPMPADTPAQSEAVTAATASAPAAAAPASAGSGTLASVRPLLKESKTGGLSAKIERVAEELGKSADDVVAGLVDAGLKAPEKPREKPVTVEHEGEVFWLNKTARGELWLNAKPAKFADKPEAEDETEAEPAGETGGEATDAGEPAAEGEGDAEKKPRRGARSRSKKSE